MPPVRCVMWPKLLPARRSPSYRERIVAAGT